MCKNVSYPLHPNKSPFYPNIKQNTSTNNDLYNLHCNAIQKLNYQRCINACIFLLAFSVVPTLAFVRLPGEPLFPMTRVFIQDTTANFILLLFFYLNYYVLLPKFFLNRQYVLYVLSVILFLTITLTLSYLLGKLAPAANPYLPRFDTPQRNSAGADSPENQSIFYFMFLEFRRHLYLFFTAIFFSFLLRTREHLS